MLSQWSLNWKTLLLLTMSPRSILLDVFIRWTCCLTLALIDLSHSGKLLSSDVIVAIEPERSSAELPWPSEPQPQTAAHFQSRLQGPTSWLAKLNAFLSTWPQNHDSGKPDAWYSNDIVPFRFQVQGSTNNTRGTWTNRQHTMQLTVDARTLHWLPIGRVISSFLWEGAFTLPSKSNCVVVGCSVMRVKRLHDSCVWSENVGEMPLDGTWTWSEKRKGWLRHEENQPWKMREDLTAIKDEAISWPTSLEKNRRSFTIRL